MNYELAKQLKDAGFPQKGEVAEERHNSWIDIEGDYMNWKGDNEMIYVPHLSELIEACGDDFGHLDRHNLEKEGILWSVTRTNALYSDTPMSGGKTPEEAVANLWLELKKTPSQRTNS